MAVPELIYCAAGNKRFSEIAINQGFTYGAQLPNTVYFTPEFVDQDWENPNLDKYLNALSKHSPRMATVLDWERFEQFEEVMQWAEEVAPIVRECVMIIPKVPGTIKLIPKKISGKPVRLAYSVDSGYSGTPVLPCEFEDRPVHLLGGSPFKQIKLSREMNVVSLDGNYIQKMAIRYNQYFVPDGSANFAKNKHWPSLREAGLGKKWGDGTSKADAPHEAFRRSCEAIWGMWHKTPVPKYFPTTMSLGL